MALRLIYAGFPSSLGFGVGGQPYSQLSGFYVAARWYLRVSLD